MTRWLAALALSVLTMLPPAAAQQPPGPSAKPTDYILLTIVLRHDQSKTLTELNEIRAQTGFWAKFPPEGIAVELWYIAMGLGHIVTLRVPPARLREVNRSVELGAWKAFRTEFYPTYDAREIAKTLREQAMKK